MFEYLIYLLFSKIKNFFFNENNKFNKFIFSSSIGSVIFIVAITYLFNQKIINVIKNTSIYEYFIETGKNEYKEALNLIEKHDYNKAIVFLKKSEKLALASIGEENIFTVKLYDEIARIYILLAKYDEAMKYAKKSLDIKYLIFKDNYYLTSESYFILGSIFEEQGDFVEALNQVKKAFSIYNNSEHYIQLGNLYYYLGYLEDALKYYELSIDNNFQYFYVNENSLSVVNNISLIYIKSGDYDKAIFFLSKGIYFIEIYPYANRRLLIELYNNLGSAYEEKFEYEKALTYYEKSLTVTYEFFDKNNPQFATSFNNIGLNLINQNKNDKAIRYFDRALDVLNNNFSEKHPKIAITYNNLGLAYFNLEDYSNAELYLNKSLKQSLMIYENNHIEISRTYTNLGELYINLNNLGKALKMYKRALYIQKNIGKYNEIFIDEIYLNIAHIYDEMKNNKKAITFFESELKEYNEANKKEFNMLCLILSSLYIDININKSKEYQEKVDKIYFEELNNKISEQTIN